jgi:hypothetical protein
MDEYKEIGANLRHYSNLRFAQLTLFIVASGGLATLLAREEIKSHVAPIGICILGLVVTFVFWIMEARIVNYWEHHRSRAAELEESLGFRQFRDRPRHFLISGRQAARILFATSGLGWLTAILMLLR